MPQHRSMTTTRGKNPDRPGARHGRRGCAVRCCIPVPSLLFDAQRRRRRAPTTAALTLFRCGAPALVGCDMVDASFPELGECTARDRAQVTAITRRVAVRRPDGSNFVARVQLVAPLATDADATLLVTRRRPDRIRATRDRRREQQGIRVVHRRRPAHDLRAPLRILKGFTDALDDECGAALNEEGRSPFSRRSSRPAIAWKDSSTACSRCRAPGRAEMTCEKLDLTTLVELVTYELRHGKTAREVDCAGRARHLTCGATCA